MGCDLFLAMFSIKINARKIIKYTDQWDQDNIIHSEYKNNPSVGGEDVSGNAPVADLRLKFDEFVKPNRNLRQQDLISQIWTLIFGSQTTTSTAAPAGTTRSLTISTTTDPSAAP